MKFDFHQDKVDVVCTNRFGSDNLKFAYLSQLLTFVVIVQQFKVHDVVCFKFMPLVRLKLSALIIYNLTAKNIIASRFSQIKTVSEDTVFLYL
jgi:hypothetical protein